jgi:hypothetical protein
MVDRRKELLFRLADELSNTKPDIKLSDTIKFAYRIKRLLLEYKDVLEFFKVINECLEESKRNAGR